VTYRGEISHADSCHACIRHGLGLMSVGVISMKKMYSTQVY